MASRSHAGFDVREERGPEESIVPVAMGRTAFVGRTLRGPVDRPVLLRSFAEFRQIFGGLWQPSTLSYAIEHFFDNGGREALVVRVVNGARAATLSLNAGAAVLELQARRPGTREYLRAAVDYDNVPAHSLTEFNLTVQRVRVQGTSQIEDQEIYRRISVDPASERYVADRLRDSDLVRLARAVPAQRPDRTLDPASGLATAYVGSSVDGDDGAPLTDYDLIGSAAEQTGLFALDHADRFDLLYVPPPARATDLGSSVLLVASRYCKARRAMLIVDPPVDWQTADEALRGMRRWHFFHDHALMYFPRILVHDKLRGHFESFAPGGAVAGMLARSEEAGPEWSSARLDEALLRPGYRPGCQVPEDARQRLAGTGVNTLQAVRSATRARASARTLAAGSATHADWQSLGARRFALFVLDSVVRGTRWTVMAPRDERSHERLVAQVRGFLEQLHRAGAFGARPMEDSFLVSAAGACEFVLGFAASPMGGLHCFRIEHSVSGCEVRPAAPPRPEPAELGAAEAEWVESLASELRG